ncbi:MAG: hypothetical protein GY816_01385 [Cytophagales bacterium]|nr:hypothetical protein [Cytophagales bacterium]
MRQFIFKKTLGAQEKSKVERIDNHFVASEGNILSRPGKFFQVSVPLRSYYQTDFLETLPMHYLRFLKTIVIIS